MDTAISLSVLVAVKIPNWVKQSCKKSHRWSLRPTNVAENKDYRFEGLGTELN